MVAPLCPPDGREAPLVAAGVAVGSVEWYAAHDALVAWAVEVDVCRERQRAALEVR